ncbi:YbgA family protein [Neobacillus sp. D3-1R]|uniref:YbgA family protein n=1 Tax=Neobacillus sp. D3-1R TaxID=3445778 RepID=UPI003F9F980D
MNQFVKPKVVVSKCLEFAECRYNGDVISDPLVRRLQAFVDFYPVCPEVEIGLGIPRETIRIVETEGVRQLVQPSTEKDLTSEMESFSRQFLHQLNDIDGFILKSKSPTCGIKDVKVYSGLSRAPVIGKDSGYFGKAVLEHFGSYGIEEEGRLSNFSIREHFLTKIFTYAAFRELKNHPELHIKPLIDFHSKNKYLFMAYNQAALKEMGQIVASHKQQPIHTIYQAYEKQLHRLFARKPRDQSNINVCQHIAGYFKQQLSDDEKQFFAEMLEKYRNDKVPLSSLTSVLKSWVIRFKNDYLKVQTFFEPYPEELVEISDSGKGREYS